MFTVMSATPLFSYLPSLYRRFLPPFFSMPVAPERRATCKQCAMVATNGDTAPEGRSSFSPQTKCCTYQPTVPNYLVGALLADTGDHLEEGRARIRGAIRSRVGVTPSGIAPSRKYVSLYRTSWRAFGRAASLACPYYEADEGCCTVWDHRTALCSTFFCKFNHGRDGWLFWDAFKEYLLYVEQVLTLHALDRLEWDAEAIVMLAGAPDDGALETEDLDEIAPREDDSRRLWGDWMGREEDFYLAAYQEVRELDPGTFERLAGLAHSVRLKLVQARYAEMLSPTLPDVLVRNPRIVVYPEDDGSVLLQGYSPFDPRRIPSEIHQLLERFDGRRPWRRVVADGGSGEENPLTESLVIHLYQHRLLIDAAGRNPKG
jgi:hypothetical protein